MQERQEGSAADLADAADTADAVVGSVFSAEVGCSEALAGTEALGAARVAKAAVVVAMVDLLRSVVLAPTRSVHLAIFYRVL